MLCGRGDGGVTGAWRQGQDCSLAGGAAGRALFRARVVGGEVLWRFGESRDAGTYGAKGAIAPLPFLAGGKRGKGAFSKNITNKI